jgi:hypothetical protein
VTRYLKHARPLAGALALVLGLTFLAPPAFAATPAPGPIAAAATAKIETVPTEALAQAAPATPAAKATAPAATAAKPFFKTGKGAAAAALIVAALTMTFVSFSKDRVQSPKNAAR